MKILYYELNEKVNEGRLLSPLIELSLRAESLIPVLSGNPFFNERELDLERLILPAVDNTAQSLSNPGIVPLESIREYLQQEAPAGKFASQTVKIIDLLIKTRDSLARRGLAGFIPPSGLSPTSLQTLLAYTYGLDLLNIGSVFTRALPLPAQQTMEASLVESVYEICGAEVIPARSEQNSISWMAAAMLSVLASSQVPPFRFLQSINVQSDPEAGNADRLRVIVGELDIAEDKVMVLIQTNIDDMSPQLLSHAINQLFQSGALDVFQIPIYMKKNRLGIRLNVVVRQRDEARLANLILKETTTLGVTVHRMEHNYHAEVRMIAVKTKYGDIPVKQKYLDGILIQSKPEYEITANIISKFQVTMEELHNEIMEQVKLINRGS